MSVWLFNPTMPPDMSRNFLVLPYEALPDLSRFTNPAEFRRLLQLIHPDVPPETITRQIDIYWPFFGTVRAEDIIAVAVNERELALAEVTGHYSYESGTHRLPVKWHDKRLPVTTLKKFNLSMASPDRIQEITNAQLRTHIRDKLPHTRRRFAGLKWLMVLLLGWQAVMYVLNLMKQL